MPYGMSEDHLSSQTLSYVFFNFNMVHPVVLYKIYETTSVNKHNNLSLE
jgi:hypothetical protein